MVLERKPKRKRGYILACRALILLLARELPPVARARMPRAGAGESPQGLGRALPPVVSRPSLPLRSNIDGAQSSVAHRRGRRCPW